MNVDPNDIADAVRQIEVHRSTPRRWAASALGAFGLPSTYVTVAVALGGFGVAWYKHVARYDKGFDAGVASVQAAQDKAQAQVEAIVAAVKPIVTQADAATTTAKQEFDYANAAASANTQDLKREIGRLRREIAGRNDPETAWDSQPVPDHWRVRFDDYASAETFDVPGGAAQASPAVDTGPRLAGARPGVAAPAGDGQRKPGYVGGSD